MKYFVQKALRCASSSLCRPPRPRAFSDSSPLSSFTLIMTKSVLVTGASGELGFQVVLKAAQVSSPFDKVFATYYRSPPSDSERKATANVEWIRLDCSDHAAARELLKKTAACAIVYCAVPKHGGANGKGGDTVYSGIVTDVVNLASAKPSSARFVALSTDLVYDGKIAEGKRYTEEDAVSPTNAYAQAKVDMERQLAAIENVVVARTSLILTMADEPSDTAVRLSHGKGVKFVIDAMDGVLSNGSEPFQVFTDEKRNMSFSDDLAAALTQLASPSCEFEGIVHLVADEVTTRYELACRLARRRSKEDCIGKTFVAALSAESGMNRPLNCALDSSRLNHLLAGTGVRIRGLSERL